MVFFFLFLPVYVGFAMHDGMIRAQTRSVIDNKVNGT